MDDDSDEIQYIGSTIPGLVKTGLPKELENINSYSCILTDRNTPKYFFEDFKKLTSKNPINIFYLLQDYHPSHLSDLNNI